MSSGLYSELCHFLVTGSLRGTQSWHTAKAERKGKTCRAHRHRKRKPVQHAGNTPALQMIKALDGEQWGAVIPEHARKRQRTANGRRTVVKNRKQTCLLIDTSYNRRGNRNSAAKVEDILEKLQKFWSKTFKRNMAFAHQSSTARDKPRTLLSEFSLWILWWDTEPFICPG